MKYTSRFDANFELLLLSLNYGPSLVEDLFWCSGESECVIRVELCLTNDCILLACISLTQEASLREVDNLRQQIYRIKGGSTVSALIYNSINSHRYVDGPHRGSRD